MLLLGFFILSIVLMTLGLVEILLVSSERKRWLKLLGKITTMIGVLLFIGAAIYFFVVVL